MTEPTINYTFKTLSSLVKVFSDENPKSSPDCEKLTALRGETVSYQVAFASDYPHSGYARVAVKSDIADHVRVRLVWEVPSRYPTHTTYDDNYLRTKPGMFPDLLRDLEDDGGPFMIIAGKWQALWIDVEVDEQIPAGNHTITLEFSEYESGKFIGTVDKEITIYDVTLPKQTLLRTEWFHCDCLAQYYGVEIQSERHWELMENFMKTAVKRGCNMILTPQFTPPLDTAKGGERPTMQLVDITVTDGKYSFDFAKLKRWVDMCQRVGMTHFEMSHLFTQWGATSAPKVMATVDGEYKRLFGWETEAVSEEYTHFLRTYLPQLIQNLKDWGVDKTTWFHISDEPSIEHLEGYTAAKNSVADLLEEFVIMDALSKYDFYLTGAVAKPVPANNHIDPFIEGGVEGLWVYYCTAQHLEVSNRFIAQPSARNRIYGVQLFKYDIEGALHWGYNFYNGLHSICAINPYFDTDAQGTFPSGDPFLVYPKADGTPEESIRLMVQDQAMNDLRALQLLASRIGKQAVMDLIEAGLAEPITFSKYPKSDSYLIQLRNSVNAVLAAQS